MIVIGLPRWLLSSNQEIAGLIPVLGGSPGEGNGNPLQYSCLENPVERGAWWAIVHGVTKESNMTEQLNSSNRAVFGKMLHICALNVSIVSIGFNCHLLSGILHSFKPREHCCIKFILKRDIC